MANLSDIQLVHNITSSDYLQYTIDGAGSLARDYSLLKQRMVKMMMTAKGSNTFNPSYGSEISKFFGAGAHPGTIDSLKEIFPVYLTKLVDDLKSEQEQFEFDGSVLSPNEKIADILLDSIVYDYTFGG